MAMPFPSRQGAEGRTNELQPPTRLGSAGASAQGQEEEEEGEEGHQTSGQG